MLLRWRAGIVGALVALAAAAWWWTQARMSGMDMGPGTDPGTLGFFISTWLVMMAAMMFPSIAPMVITYSGLQRARRVNGAPAPRSSTTWFVAGYLAVWGAAGLLGYAALKIGRELDGGFFAWNRGGRWTAGAVLAVAALYELTPLKSACLRRCRGPLAFLMTEWRNGRAGALRMGFMHGAWCLGCCWALMAGLFALGAMSIAWMAVVGVLIAVEKLLPWRAPATAGVAVVLAALAIGVSAVPESVPGLTVPTQAQAMEMDAGAGTTPVRIDSGAGMAQPKMETGGGAHTMPSK